MPDDAGTGDEGPLPSSSKFLKNHAPFTARIKKMMQSDEDVGKVAKASPILISKALDVFLSKLLEGSINIAQQHSAKILNSSHIKAHVQSDPLLDFCLPALAEVPDLPPHTANDAEAETPRAKKRAKSGVKEEGTFGPAKGRATKQRKATAGTAQAAVLAGEAGAPGTGDAGVQAPGTQPGAAPVEDPDREAATPADASGAQAAALSFSGAAEGAAGGASAPAPPAQGGGDDGRLPPGPVHPPEGLAEAAVQESDHGGEDKYDEDKYDEDDYDEDDYDEA